MTKKSGAKRPQKINPLDSPQWVTESTIRSAESAIVLTSGSPSGNQCQIGFNPSYDVVLWTTLYYDAKVGLQGNCSETDVEFSIDPLPSGYQVSSDGIVTWDKETDGDTFDVIATCSLRENNGDQVAKKVSKTGKKTVTVPKLRIYSGTVDVTNQKFSAEVGNLIELSARVTPGQVSPPDGKYEWRIPDFAIHDYDENAESKPIKELTAAMKKNGSVSFHWVTGGPKKVDVSTVIEGKRLTSSVEFQVRRPLSRIRPTVKAQPSVKNDEDPTKWHLKGGDMDFKATKPDIDGETCFTQVLTYTKAYEIRNGVISWEDPPAGIYSGLDTSFAWPVIDPAKPLETSDLPSLANTDYTLTWVQYHIDAYMYLMWKSRKPNSRWVPLRKVFWQMRSAGPIVDAGTPAAELRLDSSSYMVCHPNDEPANQSPTWDRILKQL